MQDISAKRDPIVPGYYFIINIFISITLKNELFSSFFVKTTRKILVALHLRHFRNS